MYFRSYHKGDSGCVSTILTTLITSCRESQCIHSFLPQILTLVLGVLQSAEEKNLRTRLLEVVMACIYYNTEYTLSILSTDASVAPALFGGLFDHLKHMERDFTQRMVVLSFSALLSAPPAILPEIVRNNFPAMFQQVIRELILIDEEEKKEAAEGSEEGDELGGFDEGEDYFNDGILDVDSDEDDEKVRIRVNR